MVMGVVGKRVPSSSTVTCADVSDGNDGSGLGLATHDGTHVRVWAWDGSWRHVVTQAALSAPIRHIALADRRLLIASTGHSHLYDLP